MTAAEIAAALGKAKRVGSEWRCLCPAHNDTDPSLSITENGGKLLVICRAGCDQDVVVETLKQRGLWPSENGHSHQYTNGRDRSQQQPFVAVYDYVDEGGTLLFQVCRTAKKGFPQRRPDGKGDWLWNTEGVRRVLYRLPELIAAARKANGTPWRVYICEGEKDVDRLRQWGLIATTNPGGASRGTSKWRADYNQFFRGADVVICPDNDEAGHNHAQHIAENLALIAACVRILDFGLSEDGADISDWLDAGARQDDLETLVELTPLFIATTAEDNRDHHFDAGVSLTDFYAYMPQHKYIFAPTRELWPAESVNGRFPPVPILDNAGNSVLEYDGKPKKIRASVWLDQNAAVEQMTWCPGLPMIVIDKLVADGGWFDRRGVRTFNLYRPPIRHLGDPAAVQPWLDHVHRVFPNDADHIIRWLAQRVQRPEQKINHALVLGGNQGIGKDTILEPVKRAVGPWNFSEPSPQQVMGRFNGFLKAVIMRINEARDLGEYDRFKFYDHMKAYTAAPPDVLRCDEKNIHEHAVFNVCGVIITSNHKTDGIYLPADDRRHYVAWSDLKRESFPNGYWNKIYGWYDDGGAANIAAYLGQLDLSDFDPKAPPPKTSAFWEIVNTARRPEDAELADVLDELDNPKVVTLLQLSTRATGEFADYLRDRRNSRTIPHRLEECGYVQVRNNHAIDGLWKIAGKRQVIYGRSDIPIAERFVAATALIRR